MAEARTNEPTKQAIDAVSLGLIRLATLEKDDKQGKLRSAYATASLRQLNVDAAKIALKLVKGGQEAIDEFYKNFRDASDYVEILGKVLAPSQYELFGEKRGPVPETERASIEGLAAGRDPDPELTEEKNPYDPGSDKGQAWLKAFRQGRSERDAVLAMKLPEKTAEAGDEGDDEDDE